MAHPNVQCYIVEMKLCFSPWASVNGMKTNQLKPVWLMDPKEVDADLHNDFYRNVPTVISNHWRDLKLPEYC